MNDSSANNPGLPQSDSIVIPFPKDYDRLPDRPSRILIAEDEHLVAAELTSRLTDLKFTVIGPAVDGEAALRLAKTANPDMALVDVRMPKRDGLDVAQELYFGMGIPVMIVSAFSDEPAVAAAKDAGVFGFLLKPVTEDQLRVAIETAWGRYLETVLTYEERDDLKRRLEERKLVEQAKWILVERTRLSEPEAMRALQKKARDSRHKLVDVAKSVIETGAL